MSEREDAPLYEDGEDLDAYINRLDARYRAEVGRAEHWKSEAKRIQAHVEALESVLREIRDECDGTGGEFWEGTNVETSDRMRALLGEEKDHAS